MVKLMMLPDCKKTHSRLTIGRSYEVLRRIGNGIVVRADWGDDVFLILAARFADD